MPPPLPTAYDFHRAMSTTMAHRPWRGYGRHTAADSDSAFRGGIGKLVCRWFCRYEQAVDKQRRRRLPLPPEVADPATCVAQSSLAEITPRAGVLRGLPLPPYSGGAPWCPPPQATGVLARLMES